MNHEKWSVMMWDQQQKHEKWMQEQGATFGG
jgi:hypothetical protein